MLARHFGGRQLHCDPRRELGAVTQPSPCVLSECHPSPMVKVSHRARRLPRGGRLIHTDYQTAKRTGGAGPRLIKIELLALDLTSCTRCVGTLQNIETAINIVQPALAVTGVQVNVRRLIIESEEQARQYRFFASPTVRINGKDIVLETIESQCDSCTDLCGSDEGTSCRVWPYQG